MHLSLSLQAGLLALILTLVALPSRASPEGDGNPSTEEKLERLELRMEELRLRHEKETRALHEEIDRLRADGLGATSGESVDVEIERLLRLADESVAGALDEEAAPTDVTFIARGLGLQALNPEISVTGDFLAGWRSPEGEPWETDFNFRALGLHFESYLDPYSKFKAAVGVGADGAELGEAYITRFGVLPGLNITAGKFRQQFGVVNRWHKHGLDQIDFPLALRRIFGNGGLNQTGFSFEYTFPELWGGSQEAILQVTEGQNGRVFGENSRHLPCLLLHLKSFHDLSKDTYLEIGATGLLGWNDEWVVGAAEQHRRLPALALGFDLSLRWEPTEKMRYASFEWRTELYHLDKTILSPDGAGRDRIGAFGAYTYVQRQISRTVDVGVRFDWFRPDRKHYAVTAGLDPLSIIEKGQRWQVGTYVTWMQSPFVKLRFEVDCVDGHRTGPRDLIFALQIIFAAGPHKHERY